MVSPSPKTEFDIATEKELRERFKTEWGLKEAKAATEHRAAEQKKADEVLRQRLKDNDPKPELKPKNPLGDGDGKNADREQAIKEHKDTSEALHAAWKERLAVIESWEVPREELRQAVKHDFNDAAKTLTQKFNLAVKR